VRNSNKKTKIESTNRLPIAAFNLFGMMNLGFLESFSSLKRIDDMLYG